MPSKKPPADLPPDKEEVQQSITSLVKLLLEQEGPAKGDLAGILDMDVSSLSRSLSDGPRRRYWQAHEVLGLSRHYKIAIDAFYGDKAAREDARDEIRNRVQQRIDEAEL